MTDHGEGGDPACWAHLFDDTDDDGVGVDDGVAGVDDLADAPSGPAPARSAEAVQPVVDAPPAARPEAP